MTDRTFVGAAAGTPGTGSEGVVGPGAPGAGGSESTMLSCPECGTQVPVTLARRDAADFCPSCDYPMFWARPERPDVGPSTAGDGARRRSPGASGASQLATVPCPSCAELNLPGAWLCIRCDASMIAPLPPEPVAPPAPEPVVEPPVVRQPEPAEGFPWWWLAAMVAVGALWWTVSTYL